MGLAEETDVSTGTAYIRESRSHFSNFGKY